MSSSLQSLIDTYNLAIEDAECYLSAARASELQEAACVRLKELLANVAAEKAAAVVQDDENRANLLLGYECAITAVTSELRMWLLLKRDLPDEAWNELITAQMASVDAVRAHPGFAHVELNIARLEAVEKLVFPPQVFLSAGMVVKFQECSICGKDYEDCDHLVCKPYMGRFCYTIARDIHADHLAVVEHPADKRCRVEKFAVKGGNRNRMTWQIESVPSSDPAS